MPPRAHGVRGEGLIELAHQKAAEAEAHQQDAGDQSGLVGKPLAHRAQHGVVGEARREATDDAEADVQHQDRPDVGRQQKARQEQRRGHPQVHLLANLAGQQAAHQTADAEEAHDDGEGQGQLGGAPLGEFRRDGAGQHAPRVHKARHQQHGTAHDGIEPAIGFFHSRLLSCSDISRFCFFTVTFFLTFVKRENVIAYKETL